MIDTLAPFSCTYSPNFPELINQLNCTLVISTYQAGKVIFISAKNDNELIQLPRTFDKAMGIAVDNNKLGVATKDEVIILVNSTDLASSYPKQPNVYDGLFIPRASYYTGQIDIHDLDWGKEGLWAVNTAFSCLTLIDENFSFTPKWKSKFISKIASGDHCHLNGLALSDGVPKYVSAFGTGDKPQSWREEITSGGVIIDVSSDEIICQSLPMPHSPRIYNGSLYVLLSATGEIVKVNIDNGTFDVIKKLDGFVRGMDKYGDYLFIGLSKLRQNSSTFKDLPIAKLANQAGIIVIHLPTGAIIGQILYKNSVDEIYDVQVLPNLKRPGILNTKNGFHKLGLTTPQSTYWAKEIIEH
ncbi:MAG: TIGR03032 family protein [Bacteroidia bacterium]|nr:TIGR03032 family protein [Bacteroidia bacterium]